MNVSNLSVKLAIRRRRSSKPKSIVGSESAIEGAAAEESGGRIALVESEGSNMVPMMSVIMPSSIKRSCL